MRTEKELQSVYLTSIFATAKTQIKIQNKSHIVNKNTVN